MKATRHRVELIESEASRYRAMAKYQEKFADDCNEVAEALEVAAELMMEKLEEDNASRRHYQSA